VLACAGSLTNFKHLIFVQFVEWMYFSRWMELTVTFHLVMHIGDVVTNPQMVWIDAFRVIA